MQMTTKPILISGAGLSGLLLARSLRSSNIPFLLYERDEGLAARAQGYRIRISTDGIDALKEVLSSTQYAKFHSGTSATGGGGIHSYDAISGNDTNTGGDTSVKGSQPTGPPGPSLGGDVLGVSRGWLRQCLVEGLEEVVHWGHRSTGFVVGHEEVSIRFADGSTSPQGSLLVAADGPQSAITRQLTDGKVKAYDTGARMIHGQSPARAFKALGYGVFSLQDKSRGPEGATLGLITNVRPQVDLDGEEELGWVFVGGPGSFDAPNGDFSVAGKRAADLSRELTLEWQPKFQAILKLQNDAEAAFLKMSTAKPDGIPIWTNSPRVTIMGDAVHCMTPAGGVGANTALRDAAFLGRLLREANGYREDLTSEYETQMRAYASENVKMSFEAAARRFNIRELK